MHSMRSQKSDKGKGIMYLKIHKKGVVSLCDKELVGKEFQEGEVILNVNKRFYQGKEASKEEISEALKEAKTINIVGEKSIALAIEEGLLTMDSVKYVQSVPHAQVYTL